MNDARSLTLASVRDSYNGTYVSLDRVCDDLQSVCAIVGELDPFLPDFDSGSDIRLNAATLRSQAESALKASLSLSAAASSYETLAELLAHSLAVLPREVRPAAKAPTKAKRRKA